MADEETIPVPDEDVEGTPEGVEDDGESYDAADEGEVVVPEGTEAILFAQMLVDLRDAGFPEDPNDPDGSKLCEEK